MIFTIRVPEGYKTPGALEEAARVMRGQLTKIELVDHGGAVLWEATIELPNEVVVEVDRDGHVWGTRLTRRLEKSQRALDTTIEEED